MSLKINPVSLSYRDRAEYLKPKQVQQKTDKAFKAFEARLCGAVQADSPPSFSLNIQALMDAPWNAVEGVVWGGFLVMSGFFAANSFTKLFHRSCDPAATVQKVVRAVKSAFVDFVSIISSGAYVARWANEAKIIALGGYQGFMNHLCFGTTAIVNGVEAVFEVSRVRNRIHSIQSGGAPREVELQKQWLCHHLIKLAGHVSMVAWAALGVGAAVTGVALSPLITGSLLLAACGLGLMAYFYQMGLQKPLKPHI